MKTYTNNKVPGRFYKRLKVGQTIKETDFMNSKSNPTENGWLPCNKQDIGTKVLSSDLLFFYRPI